MAISKVGYQDFINAFNQAHANIWNRPDITFFDPSRQAPAHKSFIASQPQAAQLGYFDVNNTPWVLDIINRMGVKEYAPPAPVTPPAPTALEQYNAFLQNTENQDLNPINLIKADPTSVITNRFFQLPQYQLLYGAPGTLDANGAPIPEPSLDPMQRFKQDPGYQFQLEQGMRQLQQLGAAKGLLESGPMQQELLKYSQGLADQSYQRWLGQQQGLFQDYQNRLQGLTGMGAANTGNQNAFNLGNALSNMFGTGAGAALQTGSNISSLFGNQGVFGGSAFMNTAAAQANNLMQGAALQAQIQAANQASQGQAMSSLFGGLSSLASSFLGGGMF